MNTHLQDVRAKVIEAVPEIVGLNFGCRVQEGDKPDNWIVSSFQDDEFGQSDLYYIMLHGDSIHEDELLASDWKILGRPITLADVLRAIDTYDKSDDVGMELLSGQFSFSHMRFGYSKWNLALSLDEQEPEVIEFLHKILCV